MTSFCCFGESMSKRIVVIDDDPVVLAMVSDYLREAGFSVSVAECGVYSNHLIYGRQKPDLILLDVMMPMMSGDKKVQALKRRKQSRHIPVVLMSSKEELELQHLTKQTGADGYLRKPFSSDFLIQKINTHLNRKAS